MIGDFTFTDDSCRATANWACFQFFGMTRIPSLPANSTRHTLARQWELLKLLPNRTPGLTALELQSRLQSAGHDASKRTVERDLVELSQIFPLQCNDKGTPYGWYWIPGSSADIPGISLFEALTLRLVEGSIRPLLPTYMTKSLTPLFNQARQKIEALNNSNATSRWPAKVANVHPELSLIAPQVDEGHAESIQQALLNDTQLECAYYAAHKDQTHELTLNPLALIQRGLVTYLLATAEPYDDVRQFALHRFVHVKRMASASQKPNDFELQAYLSSGAMQFGSTAQIKLEAWVNDGLFRLLSETPIAADMTLIKEGDGAILTANVNDSWELKWWILSHAGSIQIRKPKQLRDEITQRLKSALELHS
jgi:predicted DNA-binding transcriptional regulator YafY